MKTEYFESAEISDIGLKRKKNEDACLSLPARGIYCVADGMGGQAAGDLASETIVTTVQETFAKAGSEDDRTLAQRIALFAGAVNEASKWIKNFSDEKLIGQMGSTVVALVFDPRNPSRAAGLHAGDSRLYRFRGGELQQITADHSAVAAIAAKLGCDPALIPAKYQNELVRCVGTATAVELETTPLDVRSGDVFLVCSDGLTRMVTSEAVAAILREGAQDSPGTTAQRLIAAANEAGGRDNITVIVVRVGDISGVAAVVDPSEALRPKAVAPLASQAEAAPPASGAARPPETIDVYQGNTPRTEDSTPPTADEKPSATPRPTPTNRRKPRRKPGLGMIALALTGAAFGAWFLSRSKPAPKTRLALAAPAAVRPAETATLPGIVLYHQTPAASPDGPPSGNIDFQKAFLEAVANAQRRSAKPASN